MSNILQNSICVGIIILVALGVSWLGQKPAFTPTGLLSLNSPTTTKNLPVVPPASVMLYQTLPPNGQSAGHITAELAFDPSKSEAPQLENLLAYVRTMAGNAGMKGIVVNIVAQRGAILYFSGQLLP